jgi:hypothetical protein
MQIQLPDIYFFNPTCEYAVANGHASWQPNRLLQKMESDLATLPLFLAQSKDFILVDSIPSADYLSKLSELNVPLPEFIQKREALKQRGFLNIQKGKLLPWGWSPAAHKLLAPLKKTCSAEFLHSPVSTWKTEYRELYSKKFAREILLEISNQIEMDILMPAELQPQICTSQTEIEALLKQWGNIMAKAPWSSSGRGLQPVTKTPVYPKVWEKLIGIINKQGYVILEPLLNKVMDLSLQFELKNKKMTYLGISRFTADRKGQYQGNYLNDFPDSVEPQVKTFVHSVPDKIPGLLVAAIENSKLASWYEGFFGVDTLIFQDESKRLKINPCLEINVRQTMGLLSLQLEKLILPGKKGMFRTYYQPGSTFFSYKNEMEKKHPLKLKKHQIESGFISLTDVASDTLFGAYILV